MGLYGENEFLLRFHNGFRMATNKIFQITRSIGLQSYKWSPILAPNTYSITNVRTAAAGAKAGKGGKGAGQSVGKAKRVKINKNNLNIRKILIRS